jgi:hypothetical protein
MKLIDQYLLIAFVFTVGYMIVVAQAFALQRVLNSIAWKLIAGAFALSGARIVWSLIRLPATIMRAQAEHRMPERLTGEEWVQIGWAGLVIVVLIFGFDRLRRDLRKVGI